MVAFLEVVAVVRGEVGGLDFVELVAEEFEFLFGGVGGVFDFL